MVFNKSAVLDISAPEVPVMVIVDGPVAAELAAVNVMTLDALVGFV